MMVYKIYREIKEKKTLKKCIFCGCIKMCKDQNERCNKSISSFFGYTQNWFSNVKLWTTKATTKFQQKNNATC